MAVNSTTQWEVRSSGNANNGAGFDSAAGGGVDRSQADTPHVAIDNATITTSITTNVITFTGGTYSPSSTDVGNYVKMLTGTNVTVGYYRITAQTATTWTMDRNVVTSGTTTNATGNMGGAAVAIGDVNGAAVAENIVWVKGTLAALTSGLTMFGGSATPNAAPSVICGYSTTRGDGGRAILSTSSAITMFTCAGNNQHIYNLELDGNDTGLTAISFTNGSESRGNVVANCYIHEWSTKGLNLLRALAYNCRVSDMKAAATCAFDVVNGAAYDCIADANPCHGFSFVSANTTNAALVRCVAYNNTGASVDGFNLENCLGQVVVMNCVSMSNGRDGIGVNGSYIGCSLLNNILISNGGYGIRFPANGRRIASPDINYNAFYNNTTGARLGIVAGANDVTLTGDPFTNAAGLDFSLDNTANEGAACRAAGFPGAAQFGTGYIDRGAVQHADPAGGGFLAPRAMIVQNIGTY